jgi:hypothetical protein
LARGVIPKVFDFAQFHTGTNVLQCTTTRQRGTAMSQQYRIFTVGPDGHFTGVPKIAEFADDKEAVEKAMRMANGADIEIWNLQRLIVRLPGNSPKA